MLKELEKEKTKNPHAQIYQRLRQLFPELPTKYIDSAIYKAKQYPTDKPVVFGGRRLFEKLCKSHLTGKLREKRKKQWKEQRQGTLISIGSKSDRGNRLTRFEDLNGQLHLRITTGNREFIYARVLRELSNNKDKWITFMAMLLDSWQTKNYFPYTVELKLRDGEVYGSVSFEIPTPKVKHTKENGVIAIDTNASPIHLAVAEVSKTGELVSYQTISLHHLLGLSQNSKDHQEWILAHKIVDLAIQKGKAIAIENLKKLKKGMRGDGKAELRKILHQWNAKKFLQKLKRIAILKGVELVEVNPAYTSIIGKLKYSPMLGIDKDVAGAYVIARRGLGFKEKLPKNYRELLKDKEFLAYAIAKVDERINKLKSELKKEKNEYKKNALKERVKRLRKYLKLLLSYTRDSGKSEPATQQVVDREMKPMRGRAKSLQKSWRVLSVALAVLRATTCLEWCPDYSPLKRVLISGNWVRVVGKGSPSLPGQGTAASNCSFINFGDLEDINFSL